jgi:hypothetical protein
MTRQVKLYGATIQEVIDRLYHIEVDIETMVYIVNKLSLDKQQLAQELGCERDNMNNNPGTTTTDETRINRAMNNVINRMELNNITNELHGVAMSLTDDELLELIDEVKCIWERYSDVVESRV